MVYLDELVSVNKPNLNVLRVLKDLTLFIFNKNITVLSPSFTPNYLITIPWKYVDFQFKYREVTCKIKVKILSSF